ncbi:MAG: EpsG family protein [Bacteroidaceae bacterium]|nr:EpsG family protein [Bacteroidaceae bacterium]
MNIYIFLFFILFSLIFIPKNKHIFLFVYIIFLLIGGLRGLEVGTDTTNYYDTYKIINNDPEGISYILGFVEPGWVFINYICGNLFDDYRSVILIGMFLAITPFFIRIWKSAKNPFLILFYYVTLYFYYNSFNITRQMIAVSIIIFCLEYLEKNQIKKYIAGVFFAMLFHYSAIVCISHIWIMKKNIMSTINTIIILCLTYILGLFIIPKLITSLPIVGHYSAYIMDAESSGSVTRILLNAFFIFIIISCNNKKVKSYLNLFFVGIIIYNLFAYSSAVGRLALYFTSAQLFLYANLNSTYIFNTYTLRSFSFIYATIYYFIMLNANSGEIVPYKIWE